MRRAVTVACVLLLGIAILTTRSTLAEALRALRHAEAGWIVGALVCEVLVYVALAFLLHRLLRRVGELSGGTCFALALVVYGLGGIMPAAPAEGITVATSEMSRRGVPAARGAGALIVSVWVRYLLLAVVFAVDLAIAVGNGRRLGLDVPAVVGVSVAILVIVAGAIAVARSRWFAHTAAALLERVARRARSVETRVSGDALRATLATVLGTRVDQAMAGAWAALSWLADAACLAFCLRALGGTLSFDGVLVAYVAGQAAALFPLLPGGIGVVDLAVPTVMHRLGVPFDTALASTFAWRGLSLIAPAAAGGLALIGLRSRSNVATS
jgi:uncharacterized protein (TIRG00374 family)